jgi:hypothetical protein
MSTDFIVTDHGTIALLTPITDAAKQWVEDHLPEDRQTFGDSVVVEPRYLLDILHGINEEGLKL